MNTSLINCTLDGKYAISRQLGEGGMGSVYEAQHTGTGRRVAIKVITGELAKDEAAMARFEREARAAGAIDSEHVAEVLDSGRDRATGLPFLVMELLAGEDLDRLLRRLGPLRPHLALCIVAQACIGLKRAHDARVMHRDIKPANLFLARRHGREIAVKLLDFGVAKIKREDTGEGLSELTATSNLIGSPAYMSPEQACNMRDVDFRTDIWSLGVVLYRALTGRTPFRSTRGVGELLVSICSTSAPSLQRLAPWVSPEIAAVAHRALRNNRAERFQSASEMLDAIRALLPDGYGLREEMFTVMSEKEIAEGESFALLSSSQPVTQGPAVGWTESASQRTPVSLQRTPVPLGLSAAEPRSDFPPSSKTADRTAGAAVRVIPEATVASAVVPGPRAGRALTAALSLALVAVVGVVAWTTRGTTQAAPATAAAAISLPAAPSSDPAPAQPAAAAGSEIDPQRLASFGPLPLVITSPTNPLTDEKIHLGRLLFHDARLSKNHDISCNSCHPLDRHGVDGVKVPIGHAHQDGRRNTPSVYNAAGHFSLMWDGRFDSLEEQATAPLLNPAEMAMTPERVESTLRSIPEYLKAFAKAFPKEAWPVTMHNVGRALAAFERKLFTRGRWDQFLEGNHDALTEPEKEGFNAFVETGCISCHFGPNIGTTMFQKLGLVKAWPDTMDRGRYDITQRPNDFMVFRVPSLRDIAVTGSYFHDGSISSLEEAVRLMARHQLGKELLPSTVDSIATWLKCLTGDIPSDYITKPTLPKSGPNTPPPISE